jgi:glycosyltransferase involved in cell wall biosynthesis
MPVSVSYIIPTYNRPQELSACLESVLRQTVMPNELIIIDDGTLDDIPHRLALEKAGIRCTLHRKKEPGLTASRNAGWRLAQGDVICYTDDDVVLRPDYFERLIDTYEKHDTDGRLVGVGGQIANNKPHDFRYMMRWLYNFMFMMGGFKQGRVLPSGFTVDPGDVPVTTTDPVDVEFFSGCSMSFRRELFDSFEFSEDYKGYGLGEDKEFCCRVSRFYRLMLSPAAVLDHFESPRMRAPMRKRGRQNVLQRYTFFRSFAYKRWWNLLFFWYAMSGYTLLWSVSAAVTADPQQRERVRGMWEAIGMIWRGDRQLEPR